VGHYPFGYSSTDLNLHFHCGGQSRYKGLIVTTVARCKLNADLMRALLDGTMGDLAPIIRIGDRRYIQYDTIVIADRRISFHFLGKEMASLDQAHIDMHGNTLTIGDLDGRLSVDLTGS
jgi:hypothetical protein